LGGATVVVHAAVFVLREVFDMPHGEIAEAIGKSEAAVRPIAWRACEHVAARRLRVHVSRSEQQAVVARLLAALRTGQLQELMEVMVAGRRPPPGLRSTGPNE
jgi:predicted transcriptional regulator